MTSALAYLSLGVDNQWSLPDFKQSFRVNISAMSQAPDSSEEELEFDLIGVDPAIVNALRRILLEEIPTMAIEHVFIINNTSIIPVSFSPFHIVCARWLR